MIPLNWITLLFTLGLLSTPSLSRPVEDEDDDEENPEAKKINDQDVAGIIKDLEDLIGKIPIEHFEGDTMLHQVIDTLNDVTSYKANGTSKKEPSIYERQSNDKNKKSIVLKPSEDKITVRKEKKTYVGLRNSGEGNKYYVFYIYLRDPSSGDDDFVKSIFGQDKLVEYDSWENREDKLQKVNNGFGWSDCSSSIFIPCKTNEKTGFAKPRIDHRTKHTAEVETAKKTPPKPEGNFKTEAGFDVNENVDFFWDLEDDIQKARFIGVGLDLLAGGLQAIPNLLTGVFGGITEGVGGLLSGVIDAGGQLVAGAFNLGTGVVNGIVTTAGNMVSGALASVLNIGASISGGVGINIGGGGGGGGGGGPLNIFTNFLEGVKNMLAQGVNAAIQIGTGVVGAATNLIGGIFQTGFGILNSVLSFGGLGGPKANPAEIGVAIGINLDLGSNFNAADQQEITQELQQPQSGGMGGLLSLDISLEQDSQSSSAGGDGGAPAPSGGGDAAPDGDAPAANEDESVLASVGAPEGRAIGGGDATASGSAAGRGVGLEPIAPRPEGPIPVGLSPDPDVNTKEGRGLLTQQLAEFIATKMGENLGKELLKTGLVDHPGWKTMDEAGAPGNTFSHEDDAFVGFGACEYQQVTFNSYTIANSASDVLKLLTTALRTHCVTKEVKMYERLIDENFLKYDDKTKTFDVPKDNKYMHMDKLNPRRRTDLTRAFEMSLFSKAFATELLSKEPNSAPENSEISRRVYTLGEVVINGIELAGKEFKCHQVKILRGLLTTVKAAFTKLLQDFEATRDCAECGEELEVNRNDQTYLMTLMEFILHGLAPVQKNSEPVREALNTFNSSNVGVINNRVEAYLL